MVKHKLSDWLRRYWPLELAGTCAAFVTFLIAYEWTNRLALASFIASVCETIGFYAVAAVRESRRQQQVTGTSWRSKVNIRRTISGLVVEFGPGEALDTFLIRPAFIYTATNFTGSLVWGLLLGKLFSDVVFYAPAVIAYEIRKARQGATSA